MSLVWSRASGPMGSSEATSSLRYRNRKIAIWTWWFNQGGGDDVGTM